MGSWLHDLRFALRGTRRSPGYVLASVLTLGLGLGASTALWSVVDGVLLRPLPLRDGERIVYLRQEAKLAGVENALFSVPEIADYRAAARTLDGVAEFSSLTFTVLGLDQPTRIKAGIVTGNYFEVMGHDVALGRALGPADDGETAPGVMVLGDAAWRRLFGGDPRAVGRVLSMNGRSVTIVGVARRAPPYPEETDVFVNMATSPHHLSAAMSHDRLHRMTEVFARLAPGATVEAAAAETAAIAERLRGEHPEAYDPTAGYAVRLAPLRAQLAARARPVVWVAFAAAGFLFLVACANVASLGLARLVDRQAELTLRGFLGAGRGRLRRMLLAESLIPALTGAALGCGLAFLAVDSLADFAARFSGRAGEIAIDGRVLAVAVAASVAAALVFAFLPSLPSRLAGLRDGSAGDRTTSQLGVRRLQRALTVAQIAVSFALLVAAGLLLKTFLNLERAEPGLDADQVLAMEIPVRSGARSEEERRRFYETILERTRALPGVEMAALGSLLPLRGAPTGLVARLSAMELEREDQPVAAGAPHPRADFRAVTPEYFATVGQHLVAGRLLGDGDDREAPLALVINETMARRLFPDGDAVGRRISWTDDVTRFLDISREPRTVVGVVSDAKDFGIDEETPAVAYQPFAQVPISSVLFVRTAQPQAVSAAALGVVRALDADQPIESVATLAEVRRQAIAPERLNATLVGSFAALAVAIAALGIGAVLAFSVSRRGRELGIRAALGADRRRLLHLVLGEGLRVAALGLAVGALAAYALSGLLEGLLFGVPTRDLPTFAAVALTLLAVTLAASWLPAARAARVDPASALRAE